MQRFHLSNRLEVTLCGNPQNIQYYFNAICAIKNVKFFTLNVNKIFPVDEHPRPPQILSFHQSFYRKINQITEF